MLCATLNHLLCCLCFQRFQQKSLPPANESHGSTATGKTVVVKNADSFLTSFVHMYKTNKNVRDSLLIGMVQAMTAKLSGHYNPEYSVMVMIFFVGLDAKSK